MNNPSYYDCPWVNCRSHFDTYSAAVEHLDRHLETFGPEKRRDLAQWRALEFNLSLSDGKSLICCLFVSHSSYPAIDPLLGAEGAPKNPSQSDVSQTLSTSSISRNLSHGSDTGDTSAAPLVLHPATQLSAPSPIEVIPPGTPAEIPKSAGPSPAKSKLSPMPRSPNSPTHFSGQSGPAKRSTFASINDSR